MVNIGGVYAPTNNLSEALSHFNRAEATYWGAYPPDHPAITACMEDIAAVHVALGNVDAAAAATNARRSQVQCAAAGCPRKVKADGTPLDQCGGCKRCYNGSKACQTADWKAGHKAVCMELRVGNRPS